MSAALHAVAVAVREAAGRALATAPDPPLWQVVACGALALAVVASRRVWPVARHVVTIAHEGAHGVVAAVCGRQLRGIRLHSDTSGVTISRGRPSGAGAVATTAAGYPGPAVIGLGAAALLAVDRPAAVLWTVLLALALLLAQLRNAFGALVVLVAGAAAFVITWWAPPVVEQLTALVLAWFLLLGALRAVVELGRARRGGRTPTSDADQLAQLTGVPAPVWVGAFAAVALACLALGGWWLVKP